MDIHSTAIVSDLAVIGHNVWIGPYVVIGNAVIGDDAIIHAHVSIMDGAVIGNAVEVFQGALIGKEPKGAGATARVPVFDRVINIGDNCSIGPNAVIFYDVVIGSNTLLGDGASIREKCRIGSKCIISRYVTLNHSVSIGDRTKVMDCTHLTGHMIIGNDVFISIHVSTTNDNEIRSGYGDNIKGPIIEDGATIAANAVLLPGITVKANSMVGAGAVVTKNVEKGVLVAGIPARYVKDMVIEEVPEMAEFWTGASTD